MTVTDSVTDHRRPVQTHSDEHGASIRFSLSLPGAAVAGKAPPAATPAVSAADAARAEYGLHASLPLAQGVLMREQAYAVRTLGGANVVAQGEVLALWPDGSIRWLQLWFMPTLIYEVASESASSSEPYEGRASSSCGDSSVVLCLHILDGERGTGPISTDQWVLHEDQSGNVELSHGEQVWRIERQSHALLECLPTHTTSGSRGAGDKVAAPYAALTMLDAEGRQRQAVADTVCIEANGPVMARVRVSGSFGDDLSLQFSVCWLLIGGADHVQGEFRLHNPRSASHVGGCWDLGDEGAVRIRDCSLLWHLPEAGGNATTLWRTDDATAADGQDWLPADTDIAIYQDSSGGPNWNSPNHVDVDGVVVPQFCGYQVRQHASAADSAATVVAEGARAQPIVCRARRGSAGVRVCDAALAVADFWQNFPIALRARRAALEIGFFPAEAASPAVLQGGEQKRWRFAIARPGVALEPVPTVIRAIEPCLADAKTVAGSMAIPGFVAEIPSTDYLNYIERIVCPDDGFAARRDTIDEYGWRHFGELVADHESVNHRGDDPFITHYNNQYDFVLGAGVHALRSGDNRWWELHTQAARHLTDIDVYHTDEDRPAYNGGMFWHTDHYLPAATATHRTYSRRNAKDGSYGGGPANEHNYSNGLLLNYWLTGDTDSRAAVMSLADWVIAMDDGQHTIWSLFDRGPTGLASQTVSPDYHGPGRGAGNSILTLMNAYQMAWQRHYLDKAEALIRRCIHPSDDLAARELDEPEHRWSYLVFLQVLSQYLWLKETMGEMDYMFQYARESLLHYARWVAANERPYSELLHKVELPTETWPAQDIRKPHVLHAAARYTHDDEAACFRERGDFFFERCLSDLQAFETCRLTRPLVLLSVFGPWPFWYRELEADPSTRFDSRQRRHVHDFGEPEVFVPQSQRARAALRGGIRTVVTEVRRLLGDRLRRRSAG